MMNCVTKATPIHFINGMQVLYKATENWKSNKTYLTNHIWFISHHIMPLVINASRGGHTQTHTHMHTYQHANQKQFQETRHMLAAVNLSQQTAPR